MSAGHPEIEYPGVEVTTGPLGQGIANAVGLAIAAKNVTATFGGEVLGGDQNTIWCFTGDGCLQEGVGMEAISIAGHLGLDNLVLIYDCNEVTVDGTIGSCFTDDTAAKMRAQNWDVIEVNDGSNDVKAIVSAFQSARDTRGKPVMVLIRTIIGIHSRKAGSGSVHGQALGDDEVRYVKEQLGFNPDEKFAIPDKVYEYFRTSVDHGAKARQEWESKMSSWRQSNAELAADFDARLRGDFLAESNGKKTSLAEILPSKDKLPGAPQPTRKSSGIAVQALAPKYKAFVAGSADLLESTFVNFDGHVEFQNVSSESKAQREAPNC